MITHIEIKYIPLFSSPTILFMERNAYLRFNYTRYQDAHFQKFKDFRMTMPTAYCAYCTQILYPDEVQWRKVTEDMFFPCTARNFRAMYNETLTDVVVCDAHIEIHNTSSNTLFWAIYKYNIESGKIQLSRTCCLITYI